MCTSAQKPVCMKRPFKRKGYTWHYLKSPKEMQQFFCSTLSLVPQNNSTLNNQVLNLKHSYKTEIYQPKNTFPVPGWDSDVNASEMTVSIIGMCRKSYKWSMHEYEHAWGCMNFVHNYWAGLTAQGRDSNSRLLTFKASALPCNVAMLPAQQAKNITTTLVLLWTENKHSTRNWQHTIKQLGDTTLQYLHFI